MKTYSGNFNAAHLNCQSIKPSGNYSKIEELKSIINCSLLDVFAVTETWLMPYVSSRSIEIPSFNFCRNNRLGLGGGGVGIYISKSIKFKKIFQVSNWGVCESLFCFNSSTFIFGVVYLPHGDINAFENSL